MVDCCLLYSFILSLVCWYCHRVCVCCLLFVCVFSVSVFVGDIYVDFSTACV